MKKPVLSAALAAALAFPAAAQEDAKPSYPSPNEIVEKAQAKDWVMIAPEDLLVMDLAPDRDGKARRVVIQLMPAPFSQGWVRNIRKLASAHWYDGTAIVRVQDNYVVQWGDANADDPEKAKALPAGLEVVKEGDYTSSLFEWQARNAKRDAERHSRKASNAPVFRRSESEPYPVWHSRDAYGSWVDFYSGWPVATSGPSWDQVWWPVHCYGMVGVGRSYSPDTGSGAELYTVIGHAPRHLDRNIAPVGRIIEGMEHMSSLPRGTGPLGFYEDPAQRVPIQSVRLMSDIVDGNVLPEYEYLSTESEAFARYADARANRRDPFFIKPAGGADICNIPVPVRRKK